MVSTVELSDVFLMTILPLSRSTASLKVRTILAVPTTPVAPSVGDEEDRVGIVFIRVPLPVVVVPLTYIQRLLVSHVPELLIVKSPSISIAFVDCVAEVPLSITSWKSFVSATPPVVTVEEPSKVTVPEREIKVSL
jgi:hypothetical protein